MTDISTASLINQMRTLQAQAQGSALQVNQHQNEFSTYLQNALGVVDSSNQTAEDLQTRFELGDPNVSHAKIKFRF
jgi:flagellar hook-basal body complex protein FliE